MTKSLNNIIRLFLSKKQIIPLSNLFAPFYTGVGTILMFHRVIPDNNNLVCEDIEIKKEYLEKVINYYIDKNYKIVSLDEAYEIIKNPNKKDQKFVVFTFDDGYIDNYSIAYPVFKQYNIPFTIYITTSFPDKTAKLWWYALKDLVNNNSLVSFNFEGKDYNFKTLTTIDKSNVYTEIRNLILSVNESDLDILLEQIFYKNEIELLDYVDNAAMTWDHITSLSEDKLVTIGAHTTNHYNLRQLSHDNVIKEISESKTRIEEHIDKEVKHFAFPFGSKNEAGPREFEITNNLGFKTATTTRSGNIFLNHASTFSKLPRITISPFTESPYIELYSRGMIPALRNKFKRIITD